MNIDVEKETIKVKQYNFNNLSMIQNKLLPPVATAVDGLEQVILSQDKSFKSRTRQKAARCFLQICSGLIGNGADEEYKYVLCSFLYFHFIFVL